MKKIFFILMTGLIMAGCAGNGNSNDNPFFRKYANKYGAPPFDQIRNEHYMPAFIDGMRQHQEEIDAIANNPEDPAFVNTIEALDFSGELLRKVVNVFFNLTEAETNDEMKKIAVEVSPLLTEHSDNMFMNDKLFKRVEALFNNRENLNLNGEQNRLLEKYYRNFVRRGAALTDAQKDRLRKINKELGLAELSFGQNVLEDTNLYQKFINDEAELEGLPESIRQAAAESATEAGNEGEWLFTLQKSSFIPVLQYSANRELRKELLRAYNNLANNDNEFDNKKNINTIMSLRVEKAQLLGYNTPADFILEERMANTTQIVNDFLKGVWDPSLAKAKEEAKELQKMMDAEGRGEKLEAWDWWYYAEKLRVQKYDLDEEALRPYFKMENVRQGAFDLASKLWGLKFTQLQGMPVYHPDVEVFEVTDADGSLIGVLYTDYFPRAGKRSGAWMNNITEQYKRDGISHRPIIINVGNFTKPTANKPSLLTMDEVETLFHEFGHALHGLLSQTTYITTSGTNVPRDFVELPSQIMENWSFEPQVMKTYARHYETNEIIPDELIKKIQNVGSFNQGFVKTELLSASILDMDYHTMNTTADFDVNAFEKSSLDRIGLIPEIVVRYRSPYFKHIFGGGYEAGYYSYTWSAVLDSDAYQAFKETGDIYDQEVATSFRRNILERGGSEDAMKMYINFRGKQPSPDAFLKKSGLK